MRFLSRSDPTAQRQGKLCQHEQSTCRRGDKGLVDDPVGFTEAAPDNFVRDRQQQKKTPLAKAETPPGIVGERKLTFKKQTHHRAASHQTTEKHK